MNYFIYIDETGQPFGLSTKSSKYFILAGFLVKGHKVLEIQNYLNYIKVSYDIKQEVKFSISYKKTGLDYEHFVNLKCDLSKYINHFENSVVGIIIDKQNFYNKYPNGYL